MAHIIGYYLLALPIIGIQILQNETVRYMYNSEEKVINIKKNTYEFKFLKFLVLNKGKSKNVGSKKRKIELLGLTKTQKYL